MSFLHDTRWGAGSQSSGEVQSAYSTAQDNWAIIPKTNIIHEKAKFRLRAQHLR